MLHQGNASCDHWHNEVHWPAAGRPPPRSRYASFWCSPKLTRARQSSSTLVTDLQTMALLSTTHPHHEHESDATTERVSMPFGQPGPRGLPSTLSSLVPAMLIEPHWCPVVLGTTAVQLVMAAVVEHDG